MYQKFCKAIKNLHRGQKGITGLETAIILIAFVTVASVLAYSVLSAGIFSSERGKAAVYSGLQSAQSTMGLKGDMVGTVVASQLTVVSFSLGLAISGDSLDLAQCQVFYWDSATDIDVVAVTSGFTGTLSGTDIADVTVTLPAGLDGYVTFTIQILPPTGAAITLERTVPALPTSGFVTLN